MPALHADPLPVPGTGLVTKDAQPDPTWATGYVSKAVSFPSRRSHAVLAGTLYGPANVASLDVLPAVVVIPPSGGAATQGSVSYLAKFLAIHGFIGLTVDPQGVGNSTMFGDPVCTGEGGRTNPSPCPNVPFQQMDNFFDAGQSALDFLLGAADPWLAHVDARRVGATGHSEGARAASYLQDPAFDGRATAVVALDNLTANYCGDGGTPSQEGPGGQTGLQNAVINGQPACVTDANDPAFLVHPTAPAMGLGSDGNGGFGRDAGSLTAGSPGEKKEAFTTWRAAGVPSMELVLAGVTHTQFAQSATSDDATLHKIALYTEAWFALFLQHDHTALNTLMARTVLGERVSAFLATGYDSALFLPHPLLDCERFQVECP
jgi:hypothetical protein